MKNGKAISLLGLGATLLGGLVELYENGFSGFVLSNTDMMLLGLIVAVLGVTIMTAEVKL